MMMRMVQAVQVHTQMFLCADPDNVRQIGTSRVPSEAEYCQVCYSYDKPVCYVMRVAVQKVQAGDSRH